MDPDYKQLWEHYFTRAEKWFRDFKPEFMADLGRSSIGIDIPVRSAKLFKAAILLRTPSIEQQLKEYIDDPTKCVTNDWIYSNLSETPRIDTQYFRDATKGLIPEDSEFFTQLQESANEIGDPKICFSGREQIRRMRPAMQERGFPAIRQFARRTFRLER